MSAFLKSERSISRRGFLRTAGAVAGGMLVGGCSSPQEGAADTTEAMLAASPTAVPTTATRTSARSKVAIAQAGNYDRDLIRLKVRTMIDDLGGLSDVVSPGNRVVIKTNLTGGLASASQIAVSPIESYVTHPEVVRALGEAVLEAGAGDLIIAEAVSDTDSFAAWGYEAVADDLGATLIDLNSPAPYDDFVTQPVGDNRLIYKAFIFNRILVEADVLMSVAKMKCHWTAGITLSMKNLIGLVPVQYYRQNKEDGYRSTLHGDEPHIRIPRIIVDLNRARPINFALIDGIKTSEIAEGPWVEGWHPVEAGILVAGKNPVATDAVAAATMGFDPTARSMRDKPFYNCENHLRLANEAGLGSFNLDEIDMVGAAIEDVRYPFQFNRH